MQLTSKFNPGDKVYAVRPKLKTTKKPCVFCGGSGRITGANGDTRSCPESKCYGGEIERSRMVRHQVDGPLTIGLVRVQVTDSPGMDTDLKGSNYAPQKESKEEYMLVETGIGCGSVWPADKLYATPEEALAAAHLLQKASEAKARVPA